MLGILIAFGAALAEGTKNVLSKYGLNRRIDELVVSLSFYLFAMPFLILYLVLSGHLPELGPDFWKYLFGTWSLNLIATVLLVKGINAGELSKVIPFLAFTPAFLLITSPLIIGEFPPALGLAGVLLITIGSYVLNLGGEHGGILGPFKTILREKGPRFVLGTAAIWSITSNLEKIGISQSSPLFWSVAGSSFMAIALLIICLATVKKAGSQILQNIKFMSLIGFVNSLVFICQTTAISLTLVIYVISIKRFSIVLAVLMGYAIFKDQSFRTRIAGAIIMFAGVLFIALSQTA
ncbi:MAG: hypothetical protein A2751_02660 [Candidatus Doudnabacteria bacterium RIFCSPHIGHO2_01_FULL_46_14]|uniref:EamA domain-containing protein n=1 Tax=Candidatus Doudnabacteria bacterium RIFCSPHIGHO2_01_FULL_46_14 TaxID=1817824 RepID=A0A1F5NK87_9BACT|nr:MAG: hypothetical protein A2751_02660 [Candidatus Doudnabacteria bacterium RIFCSPHIGHO2_01_FULL_46_14]